MRASVERNVTLGTVAAAALVLAMAALAIRGTRGHFQSSAAVQRTEQVITALETLRAAVLGAESSTRAYLLTGDPSFLASAAEDRARVDGPFVQLQRLEAGAAPEQAQLTALREGVQRRFDVMERSARIRDERGAAEAAAYVAVGEGREAMAAVRKIIDEIGGAETGRLTGLLAESAASASLADTQIKALAAVGILVLGIAYWMVWHRLRAELALAQKLSATEARFLPLIDSMADGLVTAAETGKIESVNPAAARIFGYEADELIGRYFKRFLAIPEGDEEQFLRSVPRKALGHVTEWDGRRKDGSTFPMELSLFTFETEGQLHYGGIVRDVSERREIDRMKNEFISVVSHELRTPLTSIQGALQLVLGGQPTFTDPEHEPLLTIALNNCMRLIRIINDILDVSKIESGQVELRLRPCSVVSILDAAVESVAESARKAGISIVVDSEPDGLAVVGDFDRLVQVFVNVLSNAVKFSPAGSSVLARARQEGASVLCSVRDQGRGIKEEHLPKLFRKFQQLDSTATRKVGGTGLGLAIVKAIVEQHKGTVRIDSHYGEGTKVQLTLPAATGKPAPALHPSAVPALAGSEAPRRTELTGGPAAQPASGATILVAEDDVELLEVILQTLRRHGLTVRSAEDGAAACRVFDESPCDVVVVDLMMPKRDGLQVIEHIRKGQVRRDVPIVVISGADKEHGGHVALELGADTFLEKPIDLDLLAREIRRLLPFGRARAQKEH